MKQKKLLSIILIPVAVIIAAVAIWCVLGTKNCKKDSPLACSPTDSLSCTETGCSDKSLEPTGGDNTIPNASAADKGKDSSNGTKEDVTEKKEKTVTTTKQVIAPQKKIVPRLSADKTTVSAPADGISDTIKVICNTQWDIDRSPNPMYSVTRNGDALIVTINPNTSTDSRADFFTIKTQDGAKEQRITLSQNGKSNSTTPQTTYNVYDVHDDYTIHGYQITNYAHRAKELKVLRDAISKWGEVRTGAISECGTGIAIYGDGGFQATILGREFNAFNESLDKVKQSDSRISDVTFNRDGHYAFILGGCGYSIYGLPQEFEEALNKLNNANEKILSVSLDDDDNWAYVSAKHFGASDKKHYALMQEASEKYGKLESVCITIKGIVICCRNGVYFKNIPQSVVDALIKFNKSGLRPKVVKFTDSGTYLITDGESSYTYSM